MRTEQPTLSNPSNRLSSATGGPSPGASGFFASGHLATAPESGSRSTFRAIFERAGRPQTAAAAPSGRMNEPSPRPEVTRADHPSRDSGETVSGDGARRKGERATDESQRGGPGSPEESSRDRPELKDHPAAQDRDVEAQEVLAAEREGTDRSAGSTLNRDDHRGVARSKEAEAGGIRDVAEPEPELGPDPEPDEGDGEAPDGASGLVPGFAQPAAQEAPGSDEDGEEGGPRRGDPGDAAHAAGRPDDREEDVDDADDGAGSPAQQPDAPVAAREPGVRDAARRGGGDEPREGGGGGKSGEEAMRRSAAARREAAAGSAATAGRGEQSDEAASGRGARGRERMERTDRAEANQRALREAAMNRAPEGERGAEEPRESPREPGEREERGEPRSREAHPMPTRESMRAADARVMQIETQVRLENAGGGPAQTPAAGQTGSVVPLTGTAGAAVMSANAESDTQQLPSPGARIDEERFSGRVLRGLSTMVNQRGGSLTMRLDPPELGQLRVQMTVMQGVVNAEFRASTPQAQQLLERNMALLRAALEGQGMTVERLTVSHSSTSSGSFWQGWGHQDDGTGRDPSRQDAGDGQSRGRRDSYAGGRDAPAQPEEAFEEMVRSLHGGEIQDFLAAGREE